MNRHIIFKGGGVETVIVRARRLCLAVLMLSTLALAACADLTRLRLPDEVAQVDVGRHGVIFGSMAVRDSAVSAPALAYRRRGGQALAWIRPADGVFNRQAVFDAAGGRGSAFAVSLAEGEYEFVDFSVTENAPAGSHESDVVWKSEKAFAVPFSVRSGAATYLGEFVAERNAPRERKLIFFIKIREKMGVHFKLTDRAARDRALLESAKVVLPSTEHTASAIAGLSRAGAPLFQAALEASGAGGGAAADRENSLPGGRR